MANIPVFLASDNNYAPFVASTIASICDNTKSFIDIYVLDGGITNENKEKICKLKSKFNNFSIEFLEVNVENEFSSIDYKNKGDYISLSTYNRFLIPKLKPELDKALYSDVDVIVLGDIAEMYNENLNGYAVGAVWEEYAENILNIDRCKNMKLSKKHKYFSAGNLLIDCKFWREKNITKELFNVEKKYREYLNYADMDVLNKYFDSCYQQLSKKYCYITDDFFYYGGSNNILIRHYNGPIKPWLVNPKNSNDLMPNLSDFWKYLKMTSFYDEIFEKTIDEESQLKISRHLKLQKIIAKNNIKKTQI